MSGRSRHNRRLQPQTAFSRFSPVRGANRELSAQGRAWSAVPPILRVGGPTGSGAYAGVSSAMRPSLQPYLASKSAFTVAAS
jgi:hypothetical protein